jgi:hypothetical protein
MSISKPLLPLQVAVGKQSIRKLNSKKSINQSGGMVDVIL